MCIATMVFWNKSTEPANNSVQKLQEEKKRSGSERNKINQFIQEKILKIEALIKG